MPKMMVKVPAPLLSDRHLSGLTKLLWLLGHAGGPVCSPAWLQACSGVAGDTVRRALARLEAGGELPAEMAGDVSGELPGDLLLDGGMGVHAKLAYAALQLTPGFADSRGQFRSAELSSLAGMSRNTAKQAISELEGKGWLRCSRGSKLSPVHFTLINPVEQRRTDEVTAARERLQRAEFFGEALMREFLSLLVDSDEYEDNATPGFLINPLTGEEMQYDRYYPPSVAFEFNGPQHSGPTARFPSAEEARLQQARDYMKKGIGSDRGIRLVVIQPADLSLATMQKKVAGLLPLRRLAEHEPLAAYLSAASRDYQRKVRHIRPAAPRPRTQPGGA